MPEHSPSPLAPTLLAPAPVTGDVRHDWTRDQIDALFALPFADLIFAAQSVHRRHFDANEVQLSQLCSIKTGGCPEDCGYCNQSAQFDTGLEASKLSAAIHLEAQEFNRWMAAASTVVALAGIAWATKLYRGRRADRGEPLEALKPVHTLLSQKYYVDALYEDAMVRRVFYLGLVGAMDWLDRNLVDRLVDLLGEVLRNVGRLALAPLQTGEVQAYGAVVALGSLLILLGFWLL